MSKPAKIIHPFLFGIFPVIFLYSQNVGEVFVSQTMIPMGVCFAGGILLWCMIFAVLRNKIKSAILTSLMLIYFFSYGHFFSFVDDGFIGSFKFGIHTYMLPVWTLIFTAGVFLVFRTKKDLGNFTKILNVVAICLVAMSVSNTLIFNFRSASHRRGSQLSRQPDGNVAVDAGKLDNKPDIYYIILDEYARANILQEVFDHDSSPFISHLKDKGFFVSENSKSNYMQTLLSIPSSMNFRYLDDLAETYGRESKDKRPIRDLTAGNRVFGFLKDLGYSTISFSTGYDFSELNNADIYLSGVFTANGFLNELLNSTPLMSLEKFSMNVHYAHYKRLNYTFDKLAETAKMPSPHVVFAHILCPHTPYVFDENGNFTGQSGAFRLDESKLELEERKARYLAQLKYVDKRITRTIDGILANSKKKPIIVVQGDHGIRWRLNDKPGGYSAADRHFAILNALYLPGFDYSELDNNITPVNTFRIIFNHYFGTDFEILENRNYSSGSPHYYKFRDVTDSLK